MTAANQAYDLSRYEAKTEKPKVQVVSRAEPVRSVMGVRPITALLCMCLVVASIAALLYSNAKLTEVGDSLNAASARLEELQAEEQRLNTELEFKLSNKNVEEIASRQLGLAKLEKYQVDYIDMSSEDVVTLRQEKTENVWDQIGNVIAKIQSYLVA
ncbi:MAG: hypothetical protein PHD67_05190 [Oscillospiraceae bacterium]|nr:hypothetical protein [Oscillospiraceae bacterium]